MKRFNFLLTAIILMLTMTAAVSCTTMTGTQDGYYDGQRVYGNRVYIEDPYRGTIVLERDPWTGRYYEVGGYNPYFGYGNRNYGRGYRTYGRTYKGNNSEFHNRNNPNNNRNNNQSPEQYKKDRDDARNKILGKH